MVSLGKCETIVNDLSEQFPGDMDMDMDTVSELYGIDDKELLSENILNLEILGINRKVK